MNTTPIEIEYPDSDGEPRADNTLHWNWMVNITYNLQSVFFDAPDVFVASNLFWYAVEGDPTIRQAPDVMVAFGRPTGDRMSYKQWEEGGVAPQVVFEFATQLTTPEGMLEKREFYRSRGVAEYYEIDAPVYDRDSPLYQSVAPILGLRGWTLRDGVYEEIPHIGHGWTSPRLGVHFRFDGNLILTRPSGERFMTFREMCAAHAEAQRRLQTQRERPAEGIPTPEIGKISAETDRHENEMRRQRERTDSVIRRLAEQDEQIKQLEAEIERLKASSSKDA